MSLKFILKATTLAALAGAVAIGSVASPAEARRGRGHDDHLEGGHRSGSGHHQQACTGAGATSKCEDRAGHHRASDDSRHNLNHGRHHNQGHHAQGGDDRAARN